MLVGDSSNPWRHPSSAQTWVATGLMNPRRTTTSSPRPDPPSIIHASPDAERQQQYRREGYTRLHPLWVYFISDANGRVHIGIASNPPNRLASHNRVPGYPPGPKDTRGSSTWRLDMVVGPFYRGAGAFASQLKKESRKKDCRMAHMLLKGSSYRNCGLIVYARDPQSHSSLPE